MATSSNQETRTSGRVRHMESDGRLVVGRTQDVRRQLRHEVGLDRIEEANGPTWSLQPGDVRRDVRRRLERSGLDESRDSPRSGLLQSFLERYRQWSSRRTARFALERADDHLLRDIGVRRWEIRSAVNGNLPRRRAEHI